jgi:DNA-binding NarL/FixJ family response regulator
MPDLSTARADVSVLVVDDQPFFRDAAHAVLDALAGFSAVAEASSGTEALHAVAQHRPELVLIDVRMPGMNGIEATRRIKAAHPGTVVVLISTDDLADAAARSCGAAAFVRKQDFGAAFLRALWAQHGPRLGRRPSPHSGDAGSRLRS